MSEIIATATPVTFQSILDRFRRESSSERDKGARFERLMRDYLLTEPHYAGLFKTVWLWSDFPYRAALGGQDTGIDIVALTAQGAYWAVQCKCYQESTAINKSEVDGFLATAGRSFMDDYGQTKKFEHCLWISTTNNWGSNAEETIHNHIPAVSHLSLSHLENSSMNIENVWHEIMSDLDVVARFIAPIHSSNQTTVDYTPFEGICLTDRFQLGEIDGTFVDDSVSFWQFVKSGCALADLHLRYEDHADGAAEFGVSVTGAEAGDYTVTKMRFSKQGNNAEKSQIIYNDRITVGNIPAEAYDYIVNGKGAIEWIVERYAVTTHKESGIVNNPNDWAREHNQPRYILDLLLSVITLSVRTVNIVNTLPKLEFLGEFDVLETNRNETGKKV